MYAEPSGPIEPGTPARRGWRLAGSALAALVLLVAAAAVWAWSQLSASLPQLDGSVPQAGLSAAVTVERDALGVVTVRGGGRPDVARGLGFVHAQDRFFQLDLARRQAAGELAELVGPAALPADRQARLHRFRDRARRALAAMNGGDRGILEAYVEGVNAGLAALRAKPWEYLLLAAEPEPWRLEDTVLVVHSMYFQLNDELARRESARGLIHDLLGGEMFAFLAPLGDPWDSPIFGEPYPPPPLPAAAPASHSSPDEAAVALRRPPAQPPITGSNNWAVAGTRTTHGGAIVANDMHLPIRVPHVWYRASLVYPAPDGGTVRITGVTLPGTPAVVVGSNGSVAWGFTNTWGDWEDLVELEPDPADPDGAYLTPDGPRRFERHQETLRVKGGDDEPLEVLETIWGPVVDTDHRGRRRALRWIAHDPRAVNLDLMRLETAAGVEQAVAAANQVGAPPQNFVVADRDGRIAWTVMGPIPRRFGHDGRRPSSWAAGDRGWDGYLEPADYPRVVDPPSGRLWTANGRAVSGEMERLIGLGSYVQGARGGQIRDRLAALERASEADMLAIQLDDEALFLARWRELLLSVLGDAPSDPRRAELRRQVEGWGGHASVDSVGYRMVRAFRSLLAQRVFERLTAACKAADPGFDYLALQLWEGPLWRLVEERPAALADPELGWEAEIDAAVDDLLGYFLTGGSTSLAGRTWGDRNTARVEHPFSRLLPFARQMLDMPATPLPGDSHMPRYQSPTEGASQRMAVSPGREAEGYLHMPVGQSGHPLSPHYGDMHRAWETGEPTPFLPGPAVHTLVLEPAG